MSDESSRFHPKNIGLNPELWAVVPTKIRKRRQHFIQVPWVWVEKLAKTRSANTYRVALYLLFLHWKDNGAPIKLANGMLVMDGVTRFSKWRALQELEQAGLIRIERRQRKSPMILVVV
jgi:CRP-like cAMP-binding protein